MKKHIRFTSLLLVLLLLASFPGCTMPGIGDESRIDTTKKAETVIPEPDRTGTAVTMTNESAELEAPADAATPEPGGADSADTTANEGIQTELTESVISETTPNSGHPGYEIGPTETPDSFNGETVKILYSSETERNEFDPDISGEIIDDCIYARNIRIEDQLYINFEWKGMNAGASHAKEYVQYASAMCAAGEGFDIYAATRRAMAQMVTNGLLQDVNLINDSYIDLSNPWYPADAQSLDLTLGGATFLITGDISANSILQMNVIFYNTNIVQNFSKPDPVSLVLEGNWTLDALIELSQDVYIDLDNSGSKTAADNYGFVQISYLDSDAFYSGSGMKFFEADSTGDRYVKASDELTSDKASELNSKLFNFFNDSSSYVGSSYSVDTDYSVPFAEDRVLFCHGKLSMADNGIFTENAQGQYRTVFDFEHGILPIPKYDLSQEQYITTLSNEAVFWGISNYLYADRARMSSAVIETMAYEGYRSVTPAIFENVMKTRYSIPEASAKRDMFDLIRASIRIDIGKLFSEDAYALPTKFASGVTISDNHWIMTAINSQTRALIQRNETDLNRLIEYALTQQN